MFPSLNMNTISSIAMIIATNTAMIFTITFLTHNLLGMVFQIYPGSSLLIETILMKIGGSLYGPVIGMLIGLLTDLLTVVLTSSVFNYGYLLAAVFNGFLGGFMYMFGESTSEKKWKNWQNAFFVTALMGITSVAYYFFNEAKFTAEGKSEISLNIFSQTIPFPKWFFTSFLAVMGGLLLLSLGVCLCLSSKKLFPTMSEKAEKWNVILSLTMLNFLAYVLVDMMTLPLFDIKISTLPFEQFFIMSNFFLMPSVIFSSLIIWKMFKLNSKLQFTTIKDKLPLPKKKKVVSLCAKLHPNLIY